MDNTKNFFSGILALAKVHGITLEDFILCLDIILKEARAEKESRLINNDSNKAVHL